MRTPLLSRPLTAPSMTSHMATIAALAALVSPMTACSSDDGDGSSKKETKTTIALSGEFSAKIGTKTIVIDYAGGTADVSLVHRLNKKGKACVTSVKMTVQKADESCLLDMTFRPGAGNALTLVEGEFHAVNSASLVECEDWPGLKPGKALVYKLKSGKDTVALTKPLDQPEAGEKDASLTKDVLVTGTAAFKSGGKGFNATFTKLKAEGTISSKGNANASCGVVTGAAQCPDISDVTPGNAVGNHLKRPGYVYDCSTGEQYSFDEHCGSDAIWLTMYRRWTEVACGGCEKDEQCVKKFINDSTYQAHCYKKSTGCSGCSGKKTACAVAPADLAKGVSGTCHEPVVDGEDMTIKGIMDNYLDIHNHFQSNNVASIFVVAEGELRSRGKCTEKDGSRTCDGSGPAATQKDCEAVKAKYKLPDDVVLLFDKNKKYWVSDNWLGPEFYSNGMVVMSGETEIIGLFPTPGASGQPSAEQVKGSIQKAIDDF